MQWNFQDSLLNSFATKSGNVVEDADSKDPSSQSPPTLSQQTTIMTISTRILSPSATAEQLGLNQHRLLFRMRLAVSGLWMPRAGLVCYGKPWVPGLIPA